MEIAIRTKPLAGEVTDEHGITWTYRAAPVSSGDMVRMTVVAGPEGVQWVAPTPAVIAMVSLAGPECGIVAAKDAEGGDVTVRRDDDRVAASDPGVRQIILDAFPTLAKSIANTARDGAMRVEGQRGNLRPAPVSPRSTRRRRSA